jgi:hypothetical protein
VKDEMKGLFVNEAKNTDNYDDVLSENALFKIEDFKSHLKNIGGNEKDYDEYLG